MSLEEKKKKRNKILIIMLCSLLAAAVTVFLASYMVRKIKERIEESEYSQKIQIASEKEGFGKGRLLVEYDTEKELYTNKNLTVYAAQNPDEVGAIIEITLKEHEKYWCVLKAANDGTVIAQKEFSDSEFNSTWTSMNPTGKSLGYMESWASTEWVTFMENREISAFFASCDHITGTKLAVYSEKDHVFRYFEDWLPEEYRADSVEELAGYLRYKEEDNATKYSYSYKLVLCDSKGQTIAENMFQSYRGNAMEYWLPENFNGYLYGLEFLSKGNIEKMGTGTKLIGYNTQCSSYTSQYIPSNLLAASPEEVAYVVEYRRSFEQKTEKYGVTSFMGDDVTGVVEVIFVKVINPTRQFSERVIEDKVFEADPPKTIWYNYAEKSELTFREYVKSSDIENWLRILNLDND